MSIRLETDNLLGGSRTPAGSPLAVGRVKPLCSRAENQGCQSGRRGESGRELNNNKKTSPSNSFPTRTARATLPFGAGWPSSCRHGRLPPARRPPLDGRHVTEPPSSRITFRGPTFKDEHRANVQQESAGTDGQRRQRYCLVPRSDYNQLTFSQLVYRRPE